MKLGAADFERSNYANWTLPILLSIGLVKAGLGLLGLLLVVLVLALVG